MHHHESCSCEMGKIGEANKLAANKKRSDFYKTKRWQEIRNRYKQRADFREAVIAEIQKVIVNGNPTEMEKQNIIQIVSGM